MDMILNILIPLQYFVCHLSNMTRITHECHEEKGGQNLHKSNPSECNFSDIFGKVEYYSI